MELTTDTALIAVYCVIDDCYRSDVAPHRPKRGRPPGFSASEVLTLTLLAQRSGRSERGFLAQVRERWTAFFPHLRSQSAFNRRARSLVGVLAALVALLARRLDALLGAPAYQTLDGVAMPVLRRCRGQRHRLFGDECAFGKGGSDHGWYYGLKVLLAGAPAGYVTGFVVGPASTEERWLAETLFRWRCDPTTPPPTAAQLAPVLGPSHRRQGRRLGPSGPLNPPIGAGQPARVPYGTDNGFRGVDWQCHWWRDYRVQLVTARAVRDAAPTPAAARRASRWFRRKRQSIERITSSLTGALHLANCGARSYFGLLTRLAAKVAAHNATLLVNLLLGRTLHAWLPAL